MNNSLPLFRLPVELRDQIYEYIFFSHISDPPILSSPCLKRPARYKRCIRLWIEGGNFITHRNWLNEITTDEGYSDRHAFLRTCHRINEDAGAFLYKNTLFMIFTSIKYDHLLRQDARCRGSEWYKPLPPDTPSRIASLHPSPVKVYGREFDHLPAEVPGWKRTWYWWSWEHQSSQVSYIGKLNEHEGTFLKRVQNIQVSVSVRTPDNFNLAATQLRHLASALGPVEDGDARTIFIDFHDPVNSRLWRNGDPDDHLSSATVDSFYMTVQAIRGKALDKAHLFSDWWSAAFRKSGHPGVLALFQPRSWYPTRWEFYPEKYHRLLQKWSTAWCGDCHVCKSKEVEGWAALEGIATEEGLVP